MFQITYQCICQCRALFQRSTVSLVNYLKQRIASFKRHTVSLANHLKKCRRPVLKITAFLLLFLVFMYSLKLYSSVSSFKAPNGHNAAVQLPLKNPSGASAPHSKLVPEIIEDMAECTKTEPLVAIPLEIIDSGIHKVEILAVGVSFDTAQNENIQISEVKAIYTRFKHHIPVKSAWSSYFSSSLPRTGRVIFMLYEIPSDK